MTVVSGVLGIGFALLCMLGAESMLDLWWKIAGIFGGAILGLFVLALFQVRLTFWQGITSIVISSIVIGWGTFARSPYLPESLLWMECHIDGILIGAMGTFSLLLVALVLSRFNASSKRID
jgi:SSS family solute:Na+ symporter